MRVYMPCLFPHTGAGSPWRQPWPPCQQAHDARRSTTGKQSGKSALQCLDRVCAWMGGWGGVGWWVCYASGYKSAKSAHQRLLAFVYVYATCVHTARTCCVHIRILVKCFRVLLSIDLPVFLTAITKVLRRMSPARRLQRMMHFRCVGRAWRARNSLPRNGVQRPGGMSTSVQSLLLAVRRRGMRGKGRPVGICSRYTGNFRLVSACIVVYRVNMYYIKGGCFTIGDDI